MHPIHHKAAMEKRQEQIAALYLKGYSQHDIAEKLDISANLVSADLKRIRDKWVANAITDYEALKQMELAKIDHMEMVAWEAWERSCQPREEHNHKVEHARKYLGKPKIGAVDEEYDPEEDERNAGRKPQRIGNPSKPKMIPVKVINEVRKTNQAGNPIFLERISWCIETRCKILGILKNTLVVTPKENINWDDLLAPSDNTPADEIEAKIANAGVPLLPPPPTIPHGESNGQADNSLAELKSAEVPNGDG